VPGTGNREPATVTVDEVNDAGAFTVDPAWAKGSAPLTRKARPMEGFL
jgi:hypothetical protein